MLPQTARPARAAGPRVRTAEQPLSRKRVKSARVLKVSTNAQADRIDVTIRCKNKQCQFGEVLKAVGNRPELGSWDVDAAPALRWNEGNVWTLDLEVPAETDMEFKLVVVDKDGGAFWEDGHNRTVKFRPFFIVDCEFDDTDLTTAEIAEDRASSRTDGEESSQYSSASFSENGNGSVASTSDLNGAVQAAAEAVRNRAEAAKAKAATGSLMHLPPSARSKFEELIKEDSKVMLVDNIVDGFYISPKFLDKMAIHCAKNYLAESLNKIKIPLILGIWGGKGQGKTFQVQLAFKSMDIDPIIMSAGELEAGNAGEPAKLVRQRYREASDIIKKGRMSSLFINDLDAGAGRLGESTQYTVNNQMVNATLMNLADNPTNVQLPGVYKEEKIPRVPILCTGNDFSTLYAPLIRDGRMEKFYWNPTRKDRIGVCNGIFKEDDLTLQEVETLVDKFPGQSIDFFGALRARIYDDAVRGFAMNLGYEQIGAALINQRGGKVTLPKPRMTMDLLMKYGLALVQEQDNVKRVQLADQYLSGAALAGSDGSSIPENYVGGVGSVQATQGKPRWSPKK